MYTFSISLPETSQAVGNKLDPALAHPEHTANTDHVFPSSSWYESIFWRDILALFRIYFNTLSGR